MEELKPCPFCGGKAKVIEAINIVGKKVYAIYCQDCYIANNQLIPDGDTVYWDGNPDELQVSDGRQALFYDEINKAIEHWNTRYERTGECICIKDGSMYDVFRYTCCGYEHAESVSEDYGVQNYCPYCGAKVVNDA